VFLALEVEAAKESSLNSIEKYGLLAKPEYFEAFVALPRLSRTNNCYRSHLKTRTNHSSSFADSFYNWVLVEFHFSNSLPQKQNKEHLWQIHFASELPLASASSKGSFQLQTLSSPIISLSLFCESLFINSCTLLLKWRHWKKTGKIFCLAKKSQDNLPNYLNWKTASNLCNCSLLWDQLGGRKQKSVAQMEY